MILASKESIRLASKSVGALWNVDYAFSLSALHALTTNLQFKSIASRRQKEEVDWQNELVDDAPVRGTRSLSDIYERCNIVVCEPTDFGAVEKYENWLIAMDEMSMIEKNRISELLDRPQDRKVIRVKWVCITKLNSNVACLDTIRILLAVASQMNWKVYQLDVKLAFLNGVLHEEIYVEQSEGFVKKEEKDMVYLLKKALYGLCYFYLYALVGKWDEAVQFRKMIKRNLRKEVSYSWIIEKGKVHRFVVEQIYSKLKELNFSIKTDGECLLNEEDALSDFTARKELAIAYGLICTALRPLLWYSEIHDHSEIQP
ncbi:hypothetical protein V8G54_029637 [Vigna mungo]|uniref:Reverse transcriptase Ty1/copia-type domain-containing protein n=1 Tax=Vigna mungo TaxID=3915 RepID=A0AAQ3MUN3_VIGMU